MAQVHCLDPLLGGMLSVHWDHVFAYAWGGGWNAWKDAYTSACVCREWKSRCPAIVKSFQFPNTSWQQEDYVNYVLNFRNVRWESQLSTLVDTIQRNWRTVVYQFDGYGLHEGAFGEYLVWITVEQVTKLAFYNDNLEAPIVHVKFRKCREAGEELEDPCEFERFEGFEFVEGSGVLIFFDGFEKKNVTIVPFKTGKRLDAERLWDVFSLKDELAFRFRCCCGDLDIDDVVGCADTFDAGEEDVYISPLDCRERASLWFYGLNYKTCSVIDEIDHRLELSNCVIVLGPQFRKPLAMPFGKLLTTSNGSSSA